MARVKQEPRKSTGGPDGLVQQTKKKQSRTQEPATHECQNPGCGKMYVRKMSLTRHIKKVHVKELLPNGRTDSERQQQLASDSDVEGQHNEEFDNTTDGQGVLLAVSPQPNGEGVRHQEQLGVGDTAAAAEVFPGLPRPSQAVLEHLLAEEEVAIKPESKSNVPKKEDSEKSEEKRKAEDSEESVTEEAATEEEPPKKKNKDKEVALKGLEGKRGRKPSKFGKASFMSDESSSEEEESAETTVNTTTEAETPKKKKKSKVAVEKVATAEKEAAEEEKEAKLKSEREAELKAGTEAELKSESEEEKSQVKEEKGKLEVNVMKGSQVESAISASAGKEPSREEGPREADHKMAAQQEETEVVTEVLHQLLTIAPRATVFRLVGGTKRLQDSPLSASSPKKAKADEPEPAENVNLEEVVKMDDAETLDGVNLEEVVKMDDVEALDDVTATQSTVASPTQDVDRKLEGLLGLVESGSLSFSLSRPSVIQLTPLSNRQAPCKHPANTLLGIQHRAAPDDDDEIFVLN